MKIVDKQVEIEKFNTANNDASFSPEEIAAVLDVSLSWLQKKRCEGGFFGKNC